MKREGWEEDKDEEKGKRREKGDMRWQRKKKSYDKEKRGTNTFLYHAKR